MSNEKQQTAVEWLHEQTKQTLHSYNVREINLVDFYNKLFVLYEQAKEMEYKQMIEFGAKCIQSHNKTFK